MQAKFSKDVEFFLVYIREAHPSDGRQSRGNARSGIDVKQPTTFKERLAVATQMCTKLEISIPTLIDNLDDKVNRDYAAWPDRFYLVGADGKIAFKGGRGPFGFKPAELSDAIEKELKAK